jgi:hypothetical protein
MRKTNTQTENITAIELKNHDLVCKKTIIKFWVSQTQPVCSCDYSNAPV